MVVNPPRVDLAGLASALNAPTDFHFRAGSVRDGAGFHPSRTLPARKHILACKSLAE
jgi:hypothetical protein